MAWFWGEPKFSAHKLKASLKMASQRITLVNNKMDNAIKRQKKEIARLLEIGKEEKARIKVEHVIRDDFTMEAHELLELLCETVVARLPLIVAEKECPFDMINSVSTLIYCAPRVQIPELQEVRKQLVKKYGKEFGGRAARNIDGVVNERVIHKLSVQPPNAFLVLNYLKEIATQYHVNWKPAAPAEGADQPMPAPTGFSVTPGAGSGFTNLYGGGGSGPTVPPPGCSGSGGADGGLPSLPPAAPSPAPSITPALNDFADTPPAFDEIPNPPGGFTSNGAAGLPMPPAPGTAGGASGGISGLPMPPGAGAGIGGLPMPPAGPNAGNVDTKSPGMPPSGNGGGGNVGGVQPPGEGVGGVPPPGGGGAPDFDELTARFNALRGL
jgi:vacuolar protein sorting-associated protein IST1